MKKIFLRCASVSLFILAILLLSSFMFLDVYFEQAKLDSILFYFQTMSWSDKLLAGGQNLRLMIILSSIFVLLFYLLVVRFCRLGQWGWLIFYVPLLCYAHYRFDLISFLMPVLDKNDFYAQNYVAPDSVSMKFPHKKKNLIVVYLESIEKTYSDEKIFKDNLLPRLTNLEEKNISFSNYGQTTGTYWSMASFVAGSCGIALNPIGKQNIVLKQQYFFPNIVCLQDILAEQGYQVEFLKGDLLSFAGQDLFLKNRAHGQINTVDLHYFSQNMTNWHGDQWGAKDRLLYQKAQKDISALAKKNSPFFVTIFTLDTHHYEGYLDEKCPQKYGDFRDKVKCADQMVGEFYDWFVKQDFAKDTVLVFMGDHLAMGNDIYDTYLKPNEHARRIFLTFINSAFSARHIDRPFTALDLFPSLLESLDVEIKGHCLGLGCSVFADVSNLSEKEGKQHLAEKLSHPSPFYKKFIFGR